MSRPSAPRVRAQRLRQVALWRRRHPGEPPPAFSQLAAFASFHDQERDYLDYVLAALLMERLLGPPQLGSPRIPALLDAYAASGKDSLAAWRQVTGKDAAAEYAALTRELWSGPD